MPDQNTEGQSWIEKLRHNYRLVIMNNETFEEVGSYKLSLLNVYILFSSVVVLVALLIWLLIVFTPIKRYVPGYGDVKEHAELLRLNEQLMEMEQQIKAHEKYTDNFKRILVGDVQAPDPQDAEGAELSDSLLSVERIQEDEDLRRDIEIEQQVHERELLAKTTNFSPGEISLQKMYFIPPVSGIISAGFEERKKHYGVDVMAPRNTPVKAIMDGYVFSSDWTLETGNTIGIQHAGNLISFYKHNSVLLKKTGSFVKAGEAIAIIGDSGTLSTGPHLHFELWHNGKAVDPIDFIQFQ